MLKNNNLSCKYLKYQLLHNNNINITSIRKDNRCSHITYYNIKYKMHKRCVLRNEVIRAVAYPIRGSLSARNINCCNPRSDCVSLIAVIRNRTPSKVPKSSLSRWKTRTREYRSALEHFFRIKHQTSDINATIINRRVRP